MNIFGANASNHSNRRHLQAVAGLRNQQKCSGRRLKRPSIIARQRRAHISGRADFIMLSATQHQKPNVIKEIKSYPGESRHREEERRSSMTIEPKLRVNERSMAAVENLAAACGVTPSGILACVPAHRNRRKRPSLIYAENAPARGKSGIGYVYLYRCPEARNFIWRGDNVGNRETSWRMRRRHQGEIRQNGVFVARHRRSVYQSHSEYQREEIARTCGGQERY